MPERMYNDFSGMLLLDKPAGITSFKAVYTVKKNLNVKKAGHCGTLDPLATGLLLILAGSATKLQDRFMKKDKVYRTSFLLGTETDSGDLDGKIIYKKDFFHISFDAVKDTVKKFEGEISQIPPMFSALKHNGIRLYELARKGIEIERKPRKVIIKSIEILSFSEGILDLRIECSSGTYIRTLAKDIGDFLGCGAVV
ncbi:MAG: tRNA pseudouridine(55) synthase TruB, partial [Endomicrobia bacterium]|nr:tRNA pseudouridine(55) synthase TruB [Endomicrobiia bacterium]